MQLSNLFTDNIVFAKGKVIRVFGSGTGKGKITLEGITREITSDSDKWLVEFPPMSYGGPYQMVVALDDNAPITLSNIYIGDVYLVAGQSNMQFKLKESSTTPDRWATNHMCRLYSTDRCQEGEYFKSKDGWVLCDKATAGEWSATGYLVANAIATDKAVGIITCYQGASTIESWLPIGTLSNIGIDIHPRDKHPDHLSPIYGAWNSDGYLYDYQLSKLLPYSLTGVVWYQGESDTYGEEARLYKAELKELINVWRKLFDDSTLPFVVVQIADYLGRATEAWAQVQQAQIDIQDELDNVKSVISRDVCETTDIHPKTKDKLAKRIADALIDFDN